MTDAERVKNKRQTAERLLILQTKDYTEMSEEPIFLDDYKEFTNNFF